MDKIIGYWSNDELDYLFNPDKTFKIHWKSINVTNSGKYYFVQDEIYLEYGENNSLKWNGTIEVLDEFSLSIRDNANEIGKSDLFIRKLFNLNIKPFVVPKDNISIINFKSDNYYPQVLFPKSIISLLEKDDFNRPTKPNSITIPYEDENYKFKFGVIISGALMNFIFVMQGILFLAILGSFLFFTGFIWLVINPEGRRLRRKFEEYNKKFRLYELDLKKYNELISIPENEYDNFMKREILMNKFREFDNISYNLTDYKKGISHEYFKKHLIQVFGDGNKNPKGIIENIGFKKYESINNPYITDFAYKNSNLKLLIIIEIDEPYTLKSKKPIHNDDNIRNEFFLQINCIIIRFAEEQIVSNTSECCELILKIISIFEDLQKFEPNINHNVPLIKKWDYSSTLDLIKNHHRESYLKKILC